MTKKQLDNQEVFYFGTPERDRVAQVLFDENKQAWATGYKIWFNGQLIHSSKGFTSMDNRLRALIAKWQLTPLDENEEY